MTIGFCGTVKTGNEATVLGLVLREPPHVLTIGQLVPILAPGAQNVTNPHIYLYTYIYIYIRGLTLDAFIGLAALGNNSCSWSAYLYNLFQKVSELVKVNASLIS